MSVLSYVHQLFSIDQCQVYMHTLRWKDRPLPCPRCQSQDVNPWGTYHDRPGCKRYWCRGCKREDGQRQVRAGYLHPALRRNAVRGEWRLGGALVEQGSEPGRAVA
jgi:transposase-like protein